MMLPEVAPVVLVAVLAVDDIIITAVVPVGNVVEKSMMARWIARIMPYHRHHHVNVLVGSVEEKAAGIDPQRKVKRTRKDYQNRKRMDVIAAK